MTVIPPVAAVQAGQASGGGLLDAVTGMFGGSKPAEQKGDGSVGLFDGVIGRTLMGGAAGAAMGFLPFIPGGPILGGIMGALGGAAMGVFSNWTKMNKIKQENEAMLAAMGVQADDPAVKQVLQSGNVSQLLPLMQQQSAGQTGAQLPATQSGVTTQAGTQTPGQMIKEVTNAETGKVQLVDLSTGTLIFDGTAAEHEAAVAAEAAKAKPAAAAPATTTQAKPTPTTMPPAVDPASAPGQSPVPTQGAITVGSGGDNGAVNPAAVDPGYMPSRSASGGGSAPTADAVAGASVSRAALADMVLRLQQQVEQLKAYLAEQERVDQLDKAQAR